MTNKILTSGIKKSIFLLIVVGLFLFFGQYEAKEIKAQTSLDAIAIRVIPNPNHFSALRWYKDKNFKGAPQSILVDGYEAVRDGRTVYVDVGNASFSDLYTNIYLISYNQDAENATVDIFSQILSHWNFNTNTNAPGHCRANKDIVCLKDINCPISDVCDSGKARIARDTRRLADLSELNLALESYKKSKTSYPILSAGTYLTGRSLTVWPSWLGSLGKELAVSLPVDPVNKLGECGTGFDPKTCWDEKNKKFVKPFPDLPDNSLAYSYTTNSTGAQRILCAVYESGLTVKDLVIRDATCKEICLDFDKDGFGNPASSVCSKPGLDCNDSDPQVGVGTPETGANCGDSVDNDCDFLTDCADPGCIGSAACSGTGSCNNNGICETPGETCASCPDCCAITCGDGFCNPAIGECSSCGADCTNNSVCCGNGICDRTIAGECSGATLCVSDCNGTNVCCNDGECNALLGENALTCSLDCGAAACVDTDGDKYIPGSAPFAGCPGMIGNGDCDDNNPSAHPGASEVCDGKDNNCDGQTDEGFTPENCTYLCLPPWNYNPTRSAGLQCCGNDANEGNPYQASEKSPTDRCNDGKDNDCDGNTDMADSDCSAVCTNGGENDYFIGNGTCNQCTIAGDQDGDQPGSWPAGVVDKCDSDCGTVITTVKLSDYQANEKSPVDKCNDGIDNDCDGPKDAVDPDCGGCTTGAVQSCGSSIGTCTAGTQTCVAGVWGACSGGQGPVTEICDGKDNDCSGITDDNLSAPLNDVQLGVCAGSYKKCNGAGGWVNDYSSVAKNEYPAELSCDNLDNNCNGTIDEGLSRSCYSGPPATKNIGECKDGNQTCSVGSWGTCAGEIVPKAEDCGTGSGNGKDEDCDSVNDNGCVNSCVFNTVFPCVFP